MQPLFLKPIFQERIWGGDSLEKEFGYTIPSHTTGECWAISAHPNGPCVIENGPHEGKTLAEVWEKNPELFGNPKEEIFPLLTKILDAKADLSVQVHPDDAYANVNENGELGKTECWYVLSCEEGAELIFGHNAKSREELTSMIANGEWNQLLRKVKVKPGDFFFVPSGTIHGVGAGIMILETQQSSDTTYRVYDYDRRDDSGNLRELHIEKSIDVTTAPHVDPENSLKETKHGNAVMTTFIESEFFTVHKWNIDGNTSFNFNEKYLLVSVLDGNGQLTQNGSVYPFTKGSHFVIPVGFGNFQMDGTCELMVSHT